MAAGSRPALIIDLPGMEFNEQLKNAYAALQLKTE
jgi:hypothetical protein